MKYFNLANWHKLSIRERNQHSIISCMRCSQTPEFAMKKANKTFVEKTRPVAPKTKVAARFNLKAIPLVTQRAIIKDAQKQQTSQCLTADMEAVYSTNTTLRQYTIKRRRQFGCYKDNKVRCHTGRDQIYSYDRKMFLAILNQYDDKKDCNLGRKLNGKWSAIARKVGLRRNCVEQITINSAQVSP